MFYNTDEFRTEALHYKEFNCFTKEPIGSKAYLAYWDEMRRRALEGHKRSGGDWITGYHWWMLNFCPILQTEVIKESEDESKQNQAIRVKDFAKYYDGQYDFFHYLEEAELSGEHAELLGSRGKGKSLMAASMGNRNYFHIRDSKTFYVASREPYLLGDGIMPKVYDIMNFVDSNTPWGKRRHEHNTTLHRKASVKIKNAMGVETIDPRSWNSEIIGINVGDDINKLRGLRGKLIIYEEYGSFPNINKGWNINRPSMESGKNTFGLQLAIGTGGDEGSNFEGAEELFNNPRAYRIHPVPNKWDEGMENTECGFFYPAYINYEGAMDKDGNSDIEKAKRLIEADRKLVAKGNDPHALTRRKAEIPIYPREAMMKITGSKFPIADLMEQLAEVEMNPHKYKNADYIGRLVANKEGQVEWKVDNSVNPIYTFPHKDNKNLPGGLIIWEQPYLNNHKEVPRGMYLAGTDSYDHDESITTSLGSTWILNTITGRLVAEYTGRPTSADYYEGVRRMLIYYNALCNPENHNKGIIDYFISKNSEYLLCDQPRVVADINNNHKTTVNRRKGTPPTKEINSYGRTLIAEWLLSPAVGQDNLKEGEQPLLQLHKIRSIPLLKELIYWNIDGNYDRVSALGMLMILWKDRERMLVEMESTQKFNANESFFTKRFNKKGLQGNITSRLNLR